MNSAGFHFHPTVHRSVSEIARMRVDWQEFCENACIASILSGCIVSILPGCIVSILPGCIASILPGSMAIEAFCEMTSILRGCKTLLGHGSSVLLD